MSDTTRWAAPGPPRRVQQQSPSAGGRGDGANLADILERVLDKGIVIAGDIQVNLLDIELLTIKIRLVVASVERAKEMGIDWWERDPTLSAGRRELEDENRDLRARVEALERGRSAAEVDENRSGERNGSGTYPPRGGTRDARSAEVPDDRAHPEDEPDDEPPDDEVAEYEQLPEDASAAENGSAGRAGRRPRNEDRPRRTDRGRTRSSDRPPRDDDREDRAGPGARDSEDDAGTGARGAPTRRRPAGARSRGSADPPGQRRR